jgi:hypothetical protein
MPAELAGCHWGPASRLSWSLQPIRWVVVATAGMLGGVALAAHLTWWLGVAAPQGVVVMMRRGCSTRAQLPMRKVCNFHRGRFNESHPLRGASHTRSRCRSRGPRDIPDRIHDPLEDRGVGFGQLAPALRCARVVALPPVVFGGSESPSGPGVCTRAGAGPPLGGADFPPVQEISDVGQVVAWP